MPKLPRVLLIAEAANPTFTSVPLVGWSMAQALLRVTDGHLVTQIRNRQAIIDSNLISNDQFTAIDSERVAKPVYHFGRLLRKTGLGWTATTALASISYYYFEYLVWKKYKKAIQAGEYDVVHRITPLSPTIPSPYLAKKCAKANIPFVIGPLNGGVPWPAGYDNVRRKEGEWLSYARDLYKVLPGYRATRKYAKAIITGSWATRKQIAAPYQSKCAYIVENAIDPTRFNAKEPQPITTPIKVAFIGRLVPYKGADIVIEAAVDLLKEGKLVINIFGDGQEMPALKALCEKHNVTEFVTLHGWIEHTQLQEHLAKNDVLSFPSIREFGGGVVLEAMAMGLVPIVADYAGPGELVTDDIGFHLPIGPRDQLVTSLRKVYQTITQSPDELPAMRQAGLDRINQHFTWDAKAQKVLDVYRWATDQRDTNPETDPDFLTSPSPLKITD